MNDIGLSDERGTPNWLYFYLMAKTCPFLMAMEFLSLFHIALLVISSPFSEPFIDLSMYESNTKSIQKALLPVF